MSARIARFRSIAPLLALAACASPTPELVLHRPDRVSFETQVYPLLLRDCGFHACHGSSERFFQVFGPGRGRLFPITQPLDPPMPLEIDHSYTRALSMIDPGRPEQSLLLQKPLAPAAGGVGHEGVDSLGRNVYLSKQDPSYVALATWVSAAPPLAPMPPMP
jgi:hypothetical protein